MIPANIMTEQRHSGVERALVPHDDAPVLALAVKRACLPVKTTPAPVTLNQRGPAAFLEGGG